MQFLIRENFLKTIPEEIKNQVVLKLLSFYKEIERNNFFLKEIPKGFWIKKIAGRENLFEFRVNNGDRIFFNLTRRGWEEESITFLIYSSHDRGVKNAKRARKGILKNFDILKNEFILEEEEILEENTLKVEDYNNVITYEIKNDKFLKEAIKDRKYYYYYLNDDQYECLIKPLPLFITGSAGSGKSTITLRKILNLEEEQEIYGAKEVAYFTANAYLKDKVEEQYKFFRDENKKEIVTFFTLKEFYQKFLKIDSRKIVGYEKFKEILYFSFPQWKKWGLDEHHIYAEIYGIIKGIMMDIRMDNWNRDLNSSRIPLEEYLKFSSKYTVLKEEERRKVYEVAIKYDEELKRQGYEDLNDLARRAIKIEKKFEYIVVDEVQDLTEVEIFMLFSLVEDPKKVLLAGDIHQMINSSYFSSERIKNLYYTKNIKYTSEILLKNYRSSKAIVELSNQLAEIRGKYIGNLGVEDYKESFIVDEGGIHLTEIDIEFIKKSQEDANSAIIVANEIEKLRLYEQLDERHRIFTIEEIKGLEYENIICWNLTSYYSWAWKDILDEKVKQDQRYRKYFNIFYVGITRARKELVIMENNLKDNPIIDIVKNKIKIKEETKNKISIETKISSKKEWKEEGEKLYKLEKFDEAQYAFEKAGEPTWIKEREIEKDISNGDYNGALEKIKNFNLDGKLWHFKKLIVEHALEGKNYLEALEKSIQLNYNSKDREIRNGVLENLEKYNNKQLGKVIDAFKTLKEYKILGDIYFSKNDYENALKYYEKIGNENLIKETREKLLRKTYADVEGLDGIIKKLEETIGKGLNVFGRDRKLPLHRAIEQRDIKMVKFLLAIGADPNVRNRHGHTVIQKMDEDRKHHGERTPIEIRKDKLIRLIIAKNGGEGYRYEKE
jgi:hypothetical protein